MKHTKISAVLAVLICCNAVAEETQEFTQLSRYTKINLNTDQQQRNPLKTIVSIKFPENIETVGQAMVYAMERSGYEIPNSKGLTEPARILLSRQLPQIHRSFEFVTLENLLKTLAGEAFSLLIDPISRQVNFVTHLNYGDE